MPDEQRDEQLSSHQYSTMRGLVIAIKADTRKFVDLYESQGEGSKPYPKESVQLMENLLKASKDVLEQF